MEASGPDITALVEECSQEINGPFRLDDTGKAGAPLWGDIARRTTAKDMYQCARPSNHRTSEQIEREKSLIPIWEKRWLDSTRLSAEHQDQSSNQRMSIFQECM